MATVTPIETDSDFLNLYELAARLGVSYSTVFEMLQSNTLPVPAEKIGRRWMVPKEAYDAWRAAIVARGTRAA